MLKEKNRLADEKKWKKKRGTHAFCQAGILRNSEEDSVDKCWTHGNVHIRHVVTLSVILSARVFVSVSVSRTVTTFLVPPPCQ